MRKNMKIPRNKENPEQPVIISRIIRLLAWFEPIRSNQPEEMEVVINNSVCKKMWKILMNGIILRFITRGSSKRREKTMMTACSNKLDIPLVVSMDWNITCKSLFFPIKKIEKEYYTRKRPMYENGRRPCMDSNNLMQSISYIANDLDLGVEQTD
jgi:hypothetical protein